MTQTVCCIPHHLDDDLIESCHAVHDLPAAVIIPQQGQGSSKAYREEDNAQQVHVCGSCCNVVWYQVSEKLQEGISR